MPFFKELRRRSKASSSTTEKSRELQSNGEMTSAKPSSLSPDASSYSSITPPSSIKPNQSSSHLHSLSESINNNNDHNDNNNSNNANGTGAPSLAVPTQRPGVFAHSPQRSGTLSSVGSASINGGYRTPTSSSSPYAPRIVSISDNSLVHQKALLLYGQIADPRLHPLDGLVTVFHHQDSFPPVSWPVTASHFKSLVHLVPGPNRLRFDFASSKLSFGSTNPVVHSSWICINYLPLVNSPPLELVILLGKDSNGTFDAVPEKIQREGNGLETAVRKYRMIVHLWQAFTGEQMFRNNFGRRCFRFDEEWQTGTLSHQDAASSQMRNETKIHIIRTEKTVAELRDLSIAQQNDSAANKGELFNIAKEAVREYFQPEPGQKRYVSVLLLDSHWDKEARTITGHAALGSSGDDIKLAIFGSHGLQSCPSSFEEVVDAFSDCTRTDTEYVANDCGEAGSNWESANISVGAHLHEVGHVFGCPHQEYGVMRRDYVRLNRSFTTREPFATRTKTQGLKVCLPSDECGWHRLDALRFRFHPCFRLPSDPSITSDDSVQVWPVENGRVLLTASSGIAFLELYVDEDDICHNFVEYLGSDSSSNGLPKQVTVTESEMRQRLFGGDREKKKKVRLVVFSGASGTCTIDDISQLKTKLCLVKLPKGHSGFRGGKLGFSQLQGSQPEELLLESALTPTKLLVSIKVYHGAALDGMEFFYEDSTSQLFGKRGGKPGGDEFVLDTRRGEILLGFHVRAGLWIDGIEILTSLGKKSGVYGNENGGSGHTLIPPLGYKIAGISGTCGSWVDGFSLIISH